MLMIQGRIVDRLQLLGSDNRSLGDARFFETVVNRNVHFFRKNLQRMLRQRCLSMARRMPGYREDHDHRE